MTNPRGATYGVKSFVMHLFPFSVSTLPDRHQNGCELHCSNCWVVIELFQQFHIHEDSPHQLGYQLSEVAVQWAIRSTVVSNSRFNETSSHAQEVNSSQQRSRNFQSRVNQGLRPLIS